MLSSSLEMLLLQLLLVLCVCEGEEVCIKQLCLLSSWIKEQCLHGNDICIVVDVQLENTQYSNTLYNCIWDLLFTGKLLWTKIIIWMF